MEDLILRIKWANVINLERVTTSSEVNGRPWEAWKPLKQFHPVKYDENVQVARLLRIASREPIT